VQRLSADTQPTGHPHGHELLALGRSINAALDRLSTTYQQLETFNADAANELRTPVSNLIGQTQVALSRERSAPALREVLQSHLEELERLRCRVVDMLFLARAEQGGRAQDPGPVSLAEEMGKIIEFFDMLLGDAQVVVQRSLLRRALSNPLHNAIQHGNGGPLIEVNLSTCSDGGAQRSMTNSSTARAPAQLQHGCTASTAWTAPRQQR
jgi:two-component system heavy metal sensor histidine kinase CusS